MAYSEKRMVAWGDCDPAGILYTPRVYDYCTEALDNFFRTVLGCDWVALLAGGNGQPMVHTECDYLKPMRPGLELTVTVTVTATGRSSVTYAIDGMAADGTAHFRARYVACFIDIESGAAVPIPERFRAILERELAGHGQ
ncbi:MAG: acyl-CoA thioesterase [Solirubrobacterales bacterium]